MVIIVIFFVCSGFFTICRQTAESQRLKVYEALIYGAIGELTHTHTHTHIGVISCARHMVSNLDRCFTFMLSFSVIIFSLHCHYHHRNSHHRLFMGLLEAQSKHSPARPSRTSVFVQHLSQIQPGGHIRY